MASISISIITATFNAEVHLPGLIKSLVAQSDQDFEWVVADGGSTDGSLEIIEQAKTLLQNVVVDSRPDHGIYDALNRGIRFSSGCYYIVLGADDQLFEDGIAKYKSECEKSLADFVTCRCMIADHVASVRRPRWEFLYSTQAHVTSHAVGLATKKVLHERFGYYSRNYPITADQLFILFAIKHGATVFESQHIVGHFSNTGVSHSDAAGALTESFRVNLKLGHNFYIQLFLLILRLIKNSPKIFNASR